MVVASFGGRRLMLKRKDSLAEGAVIFGSNDRPAQRNRSIMQDNCPR